MTFRDQWAINAHYETAHGSFDRQRSAVPTHECPECGKMITSKSNLTVHMKTMHAGEQIFVCRIKDHFGNMCARPFKTKYYLARHIKKVHSQE